MPKTTLKVKWFLGTIHRAYELKAQSRLQSKVVFGWDFLGSHILKFSLGIFTKINPKRKIPLFFGSEFFNFEPDSKVSRILF